MFLVKFEVDLNHKTTIEMKELEKADPEYIEERLHDWAERKGAKNPKEDSLYEIVKEK